MADVYGLMLRLDAALRFILHLDENHPAGLYNIQLAFVWTCGKT
jgi:hypothetical protein